MHIVCCMKQVPDAAQVRIDPDTGTLVRAGIESICNPYDLAAVEAAVRLVETHGGAVTVICMGPPGAATSLRQCLSLGATEAILLSDRAFAGADTLATSYTLSLAILKLAASRPVDLVICGKQAVDGDTAQTGPGIATRLGFTQLTYVSEIVKLDLDRRAITVRREVEGGVEVIEGKLPVLLTAELNLAAPRYASLPEIVRSLRQEVKVWTAPDIAAEAEKVGMKGSPTWVKAIFAPPGRKGGKQFDAREDRDRAVREFMEALFPEGVVDA